MLGIYVHVPFCVKKCGYCDFLSFPGMENCFRGYVKALCGEIESRGKLHGTEEGGKARVDTVLSAEGRLPCCPRSISRKFSGLSKRRST